MYGIRMYTYSKRVTWLLWSLLVFALAFAVVTTLMAWRGWGPWAVSLGASAAAFLVPFAIAKYILFNTPMEVGFKCQTSRYSWMVSLIGALVCKDLWHLTDGGLAFWLVSFPVSLLVIPIALWILTRVISERDKGRFLKPSPSAKTIIVTAVVVATVFAQK